MQKRGKLDILFARTRLPQTLRNHYLFLNFSVLYIASSLRIPFLGRRVILEKNLGDIRVVRLFRNLSTSCRAFKLEDCQPHSGKKRRVRSNIIQSLSLFHSLIFFIHTIAFSSNSLSFLRDFFSFLDTIFCVISFMLLFSLFMILFFVSSFYVHFRIIVRQPTRVYTEL